MLILAGESAQAFCDNTAQLWSLLGTFITVIKIVIPILLIIFGMLDMGKAVTGGKDDEIKKSAASFGRRVAGAVLVFFIPSIVGIVMAIIADSKVEGTTDYCSCIKYATGITCNSNK
jgi:heme/copper-type cytochrome/quinol oxidase subunit 2